MRTVYCPKSHVEFARGSAGKEFGHVPGHKYHDVDTILTRRGGNWRCQIVETWGSAQGYDEEHGRREVVGRGEICGDAMHAAIERAKDAGIDAGYLAQAMSRLEEAADEATAI